MHQLKSAAPESMFRTSRATTPEAKVDRKENIIYGAALMQIGDLNEGDNRNWTVDSKTLDQAQKFMSSRAGAKARFTHPNMSNDGMGSYLGRWRNVRVDGDTLRGDLHLSSVAFSSPQGDLGNYVMDLAEDDPESFGVSLAGKLDMEDLRAWDDSSKKDRPEKWPIRFSAVRAADVVDEPAATKTGLFYIAEPDLRNLPRQATLLLDTYFGDSPADVVRERINSFLDKYLSEKGISAMAESTENTPVEQSEPEAPVAQSPKVEAADLSAAGNTVEQTSSTEDFAAAERERCKKIRALCSLAGLEDKFNQFVDAGFSVAETTEAIKAIQGRKSTSLSQDAPKENPSDEERYKGEFAANPAMQNAMTFEQFCSLRRFEEGKEPLVPNKK